MLLLKNVISFLRNTVLLKFLQLLNPRFKIVSILNRGPRSLSEYLEIFPNACPNCGSKDWVKIYWKIDKTNINNTNSSSELNSYDRCVYCSYTNAFLSCETSFVIEGDWYLEIKKVDYRVSSPYLNAEEEDSIVDWNWKT